MPEQIKHNEMIKQETKKRNITLAHNKPHDDTMLLDPNPDDEEEKHNEEFCTEKENARRDRENEKNEISWFFQPRIELSSSCSAIGDEGIQ